VIDEVAPRYDIVLLDTGAGISDVVLYTVSLAGEVLVVVTPEPTSMTDAYATIKVLAMQQERRDVRLVVNQVARAGDGKGVAAQLQQVVDRFVSPSVGVPVRVSLLGDVPTDPAVREAVKKRQLVVETQPGTAAAQSIATLAARLNP
jgi:flagellar biosynthesis protein FlhG